MIPPHVRSGIELDDDALARELLRMTDAYTDRIAAVGAAEAETTPWQFVNDHSRLVVDPERFPDAREEMLEVGMGAVYTRTSSGAPLRTVDLLDEAGLIARYFTPYAAALTELVDDRLDACGGATIIDVHSFPSIALPYELHSDLARPEICIGRDTTHTPPELEAAAVEAFSGFGRVGINMPFIGTYVPLAHYGADHRVRSIMLEVRRDLYMDEMSGEPSEEALHALGGGTRAVDRRRIRVVVEPRPDRMRSSERELLHDVGTGQVPQHDVGHRPVVARRRHQREQVGRHLLHGTDRADLAPLEHLAAAARRVRTDRMLGVEEPGINAVGKGRSGNQHDDRVARVVLDDRSRVGAEELELDDARHLPRDAVGREPVGEEAERRRDLRVAIEQEGAVVRQPAGTEGLGLPQHPAPVRTTPRSVGSGAEDDVGVGVPRSDGHLSGEVTRAGVVEWAVPTVLQ